MVADIIDLLKNSLTITLLIAYFFAFWAALVAWTWFDISHRTDNFFYRLGSILIVATGALFGFAIYLLLRPALTKEETYLKEIEEAILKSQTADSGCPVCFQYVRDEYLYCPNCATKLKDSCDFCKEQVNIAWSVCPHCGKERKATEVVPTPLPQPVVAEVTSAPKTKIFGKAVFSTIVNLLRSRYVKVKKITSVPKPKAGTNPKVKKTKKSSKTKKS